MPDLKQKLKAFFLLFLEKTQFFKYIAVNDDRTCQRCDQFDKGLYTQHEIDVLFPFATRLNPNVILPNTHPNCRCLLVLWEE